MFEAVLSASPATCFSQFIDVGSARLWLPGLKKAKVVRSDARGRAAEVSYEFGESLSYALVYHYDEVQHRVRWVTSAGMQDGVSGSASFELAAEGCLFRYALESLRGRSPLHETEVGQAFVAFVRKAT